MFLLQKWSTSKFLFLFIITWYFKEAYIWTGMLSCQLSDMHWWISFLCNYAYRVNFHLVPKWRVICVFEVQARTMSHTMYRYGISLADWILLKKIMDYTFIHQSAKTIQPFRIFWCLTMILQFWVPCKSPISIF